MGTGRKKIEIKKIKKESARMVTFSKRRQGLFKKAHEFRSKTGADIALVVFSPTGRPYTFYGGDPSVGVEATVDHCLSKINGNGATTDVGGLVSAWLDTINAETTRKDVEELRRLKEQLVQKREMLASRIEDEFVQSLFA